MKASKRSSMHSVTKTSAMASSPGKSPSGSSKVAGPPIGAGRPAGPADASP
jgi:hypothetical protein